ncbi:MAG: hypothetical protein FJX75_23005 [Armatimonadetes bacterium]|nr:hypothetical protein [Armatimonadota bacterium]
MMRRVSAWIGLSAGLVVWGAAVQCAELSPRFDPNTMIRAAEVKPGMRGTAKSVFRGVEISEFSVEVLGVLPKTNLGGDLVLIRVLDGPVVERGAGIVGGMSGSPVYVDGRLLGAVAYSWSFEKEPIGGVTPIESMLDAYVPESKDEKTASASGPVPLHGRRLTQARVAPIGEGAAFADAHTINLAPVGLMTCAGLSRQTLADYAEFLQPYGIQPVAGPGSMAEVVDADLVPGAGVAVDLLRGDFESSMIGTVTYRDGNSVLIFGHPMMQLGPVDVPMSTAFIHDFIPSYARADKMGSSMKPVGALRTDGGWSVGGLVGPQAPMVPVDITVTDETTGRTRSYHCDAAKEKTLTQGLVSMAIASAVEAGFRPSGEGTAQVSFEVEGERGAKVQRHNIYWDQGSIAAACTQEVSSSIFVLRRNPFEPQEPSRVSVNISLSEKNTMAAIEEVYTDETVAKAGEKLTVHVVLRPWNGKPFEKVVELALPDDLERGQMRIGICGGEYAYTMRDRLGLLQPDFTDLPSIIKDIEATEYNNQLYVAAALPNSGLGVGRYLLHWLPSSISNIMSSSRTTDIRGGKEEASKLIDCDHVILGQEYLTLGTEDKTGARAATPPPSAQQAPPPPPAPPRVSAESGGRTHVNPLTAPPLEWAAVRAIEQWPGERAEGAAPVAEAPKTATPGKPVVKKRPEGGPPDKGKGEEEPEGKPEEEKDEGALVRQPAEWRQTETKDFEEGEAEGLAIRSDGALVVADKVVGDWLIEPQRGVWSVAGGPDGSTYYGTGKDGRVCKFVEGGDPQVICETGELAVHALTFSGQYLYAGTAPGGKLFRVDPAKPGSGEAIATLPDRYIWTLLPDGNGGVYAGTGSKGRIQHVSATGEVKRLVELPAQHVLCLARLGDDLLAGTSENGVVYRVRPSGEFTALYDDDDPAVTGVAATPAGEVYAATSPKGHVVYITPGKEPREVLKLDKKAATCMAAVGETVYVGTTDDGSLLSVTTPDRHADVGKLKSSEVSCLAASGNRLLAGAFNPGRIAVLDTAAKTTGTFESAVLDGERTARWASLLWTGEVPDAAQLDVQARVGQTSDPDDGTWSTWSVPFPRTAARKADLPSARYVQYRVTMGKADSGATPVFRSLVLKYLPANQRPELKLTEPKDGASISGKFKLKWEGKDADDDDLRYAVYIRPEGKDAWQLLKGDLEDADWEWDTKGKDVSEGVIAVRVVATDALSNPSEPLEQEATAFPVIVDNTAPRFEQQGETVVAEDKTVTIQGSTWDEASAIVGIEYRVGKEGPWKSIGAKDGLFDTAGEGFALHTAALDPGEQVITIRVRDAAGNKTDTEIKVTIPGVPKEEEKKSAEEPKPVG